MTRRTELNTFDLVLIHSMLELRATDLETYIRDTDYSTKYTGKLKPKPWLVPIGTTSAIFARFKPK